MSETVTNKFDPDYAIHPGEILAEYLESMDMTQANLANRTGLTPKTINEIVKAKAPVTPDTALKFERVLGRPAHFWSNLQSNYDEFHARLRDRGRMDSASNWLQRVPVGAMAKLGWIRTFRDKEQQTEELLRFFAVASVEQWGKVWSVQQTAFRQSTRGEFHLEAVAAWLRQGERLAQRLECGPFDRREFAVVLREARGLTREPPDVFQPRLESLCASAGVVVAFVPELPKTGLHGATRWLGPKKALIQLSLRYKRDDQLWFSFFHEAGHIMLHGKDGVFLEFNGADDDREREANAFAADTLIPRRDWEQFRTSFGRSLDEVRRFAAAQGIAPGIVVGRLQHEEIVGWNWGNGFRRRFEWVAGG